ncbi:coiled-coil domain-containing protein [Chlorobium phaeobacteroides]|uniref:Chromosome segregation ATPases-like protein n=1 Tax=Chlorobium phaeobacteroides (strain DSM 266 / SMG 266 / 2430) TaxID=290317 RepID=A1BIV4_CHLPD|nr:chromosome segregation ATPase-like protein [Chlorobium phaeobacteroides]ABL66331.1 Chromosome segregation ATPases-like protein [Chlorobium phaeobacteroides DSM 266]
MNKIVIVGHPQSGYQEVEQLLHACGMKTALPSKRDELFPADIGAILCKAHKTPELSQVNSENDIGQIDAGAVWQGMALDLLLGNLDQDLWGWSDPNAIFMLDYWKTIDPAITFVLAYDQPHRVLLDTPYSLMETLSSDMLQHRLNNWTAYNSALMRFFLNNSERCMLVHVQQVRLASENYLKQLQDRLGGALPKNALPPQNGTLPAFACLNGSYNGGTRYPHGSTAKADLYLSDNVIAEHPDCMQRYEELQSVATLPFDNDHYTDIGPTDAWLSHGQLRTQDKKHIEQLIESRHQLELRLQQKLSDIQQELEERNKQSKEQIAALGGELEARTEELEKTREEQRSGLRAAKEENELLLTQLHQVQEELERYFLENLQLAQKAESEMKKVESQTNANKELSVARQEADARSMQLEKQLKSLTGALEIGKQELEKIRKEQNAQLKNTKEENELLLTQLQRMREEVERYKLENRQLAQKAESEVKKVENQTKANKELSIARQEAEARSLQLEKQLESLTGALDKTREERRAELQDAKVENELLLTQLHQVQEELERYYHENRKLKESQVPIYTGAPERIKHELPYRLGAVMISNSRTFSGWFQIPAALAREKKAFLKEKADQSHQTLPPLILYRDVEQAKKIKKHLSYRLGSILVEKNKSPIGWLLMPYQLGREVFTFRKEKLSSDK